MPDVVQQTYPPEQWAGLWGWARGDEPGPIDMRPIDEAIPDEPGILDDLLGILPGALGDAIDPLGVLGTNTSTPGQGAAGGTKSAGQEFARTAGQALGTILGYAVVAAFGYLLLKDTFDLSSKAT